MSPFIALPPSSGSFQLRTHEDLVMSVTLGAAQAAGGSAKKIVKLAIEKQSHYKLVMHQFLTKNEVVLLENQSARSGGAKCGPRDHFMRSAGTYGNINSQHESSQGRYFLQLCAECQ